MLPTRPCQVTGPDIPAEPEKRLALNDGADWRKPSPLFQFSRTNANRRFAGFLDAL